jgi:YesN/AraC family two-component response regulator
MKLKNYQLRVTLLMPPQNKNETTLSDNLKNAIILYLCVTGIILPSISDGLKIYIKNMVCIRCKMLVKSELAKLGLHYAYVELGEADVMEKITNEQLIQLGNALKKDGLELMDDKKSILVEKIKTVIIELVHDNDDQIKVNLSDYLGEKLTHNYTYLANLFSEVKGTTIEKFYLAHKIEKVKELLVYDELTLNEIAYRLNYSSVAHLSAQFKKMTGLTPSHFKNLKHKRLNALGNV